MAVKKRKGEGGCVVQPLTALPTTAAAAAETEEERGEEGRGGEDPVANIFACRSFLLSSPPFGRGGGEGATAVTALSSLPLFSSFTCGGKGGRGGQPPPSSSQAPHTHMHFAKKEEGEKKRREL